MAAATEFEALGSRVRLITLREEVLPDAAHVLREQLDELDRTCSRFRPDSELVAVNQRAGSQLELSGLLAELMLAALEAARATDGAVDPTIGRSLRELGYDRDFELVPKDAGSSAPSWTAAPGWRTVELDAAGRTLHTQPGVELDLGATAKAFAADRAAAAIAALGAGGVLVSLGGDISVRGDPPEGGWPILITDDHRAPVDSRGHVVNLTAGGLATSSVTVRRWRRGGAELHHIVDPATGRSADSHWQRVSVVASTCVEANAASTAAIVWGAGAVDRLRRWGLPARLVALDGQVTSIGGWPAS